MHKRGESNSLMAAYFGCGSQCQSADQYAVSRIPHTDVLEYVQHTVRTSVCGMRLPQYAVCCGFCSMRCTYARTCSAYCGRPDSRILN